MRSLSEKFMKDLRTGILSSILERVKQDDTLMLAIRKDYVNIYYRGGNILKLEETKGKSYRASFEENYIESCGELLPDLPDKIQTAYEAKVWMRSFAQLKQIMDLHFGDRSKLEREFQQLVFRENNNLAVSNNTEYFITDIELADSDIGARFDMLAIRWLAKQRTSGKMCRPVFIEMKYGEKTLDGAAGLEKHLQDIESLIEDEKKYKMTINSMKKQFRQLYDLELLEFNWCKNVKEPNLSEKPEVIFLLANCNPRATGLFARIEEIKPYTESEKFDLKFFVASFAGYGMHQKCMYDLDSFRKILT